MQHSLKKLYGCKLAATDGYIGHVRDFYFDDQHWTIRYVVVDTTLWLPGWEVLLSPYAFGYLTEIGNHLRVNLTRKQIERSPSIDAHQTVSRQYEEQYHRYYGWPDYWQGDGLWGVGNFPILSAPPETLSDDEKNAVKRKHAHAESHLRSTQVVTGYHVKEGNEGIGHINDFVMDARSWALLELVIKTGHWFSGKETRIPMSQIEQISFDESTVIVSEHALAAIGPADPSMSRRPG
jgi:uncharacterized protein YrrD